MSASNDLQLIAKIVDVAELKPVIDAGIVASKFRDQDARLMFDFIMRYYKSRKTMGVVPTRALLEAHYPSVELPDPTRLPLSAVIVEFQETALKANVAQLLDFMSERSDFPAEMLPKAQQIINDLMKARRTSRDLVVAEALEELKQRYEDAKNRDMLKGIPYPWKIMNDETQGMQNGEYIIFYGRPKSMKTYVALYICACAYDIAHRRILIYTREMTPEQMMDRTICMLIGAPYDALKKGYLDKIPHPFGGTMEDAFYGLLSTMKTDEKAMSIGDKHRTIIITSDRDDREGGGVTGLRRKLDDYQPDLAFVDAVYLMRNDRSGVRSVKWSEQSAISQDLKDTAQDYNIPILATLQANRKSEDDKGGSAANMAFSDSYAQDCDLAAEILKKRIDKFHNELALAITASRETNIAGLAIHGDPCENFGQLYKPLTDKYGVPITIDGKEQIEPVVFEDTADVLKMFKKGPEDETPRSRQDRGPNNKPATKDRGMAAIPGIMKTIGGAVRSSQR